MALPKEPKMMLSIVNTRLRDRFKSLEDLAEDADEDAEEIRRILASEGFIYDREANRFRPAGR